MTAPAAPASTAEDVIQLHAPAHDKTVYANTSQLIAAEEPDFPSFLFSERELHRSVKVFRKGDLKDMTIRIGEQPENLDQVAMRGGPGRDRNAAGGVETTGELRGMKLATPTDELAEKYGLTPELRKGALVTEVKPRSGAFKAGLRPGDVVTEVAGKPVTSAKEAAAAIAKEPADKILLLYVTGPAGARFVFVEPTK